MIKSIKKKNGFIPTRWDKAAQMTQKID